MIKKTLYFGNPVYLSLQHNQLFIKLPEVENNAALPDKFKQDSRRSIPVEDIGVVILDHQQITLTQPVLSALLGNNVAVITCDTQHMPVGVHLPLYGNTIQQERFKYQIDASLPLKKQLWQQTIRQKIYNQAAVLSLEHGVVVKNMLRWAEDVKSGDPDNLEGRAAVYYWKNLFPDVIGFTRDREGISPNHMLNYGYAILRAIMARSLVGSGLLPTLGIHHHNRYNAFCLADDIMEPYRPYVDRVILEIIKEQGVVNELTKDIKKKLLSIPVLDVIINGRRSPLLIAAGLTTSSLAACYTGEQRRIAYPEIK